MRVISGKYRGSKLFSPDDNRVRPTTDRVKESIFNILCNKATVENANVLDLFAGSGALGIETLSRGARHVTFIDKDKDSVKLVLANLTKINADSACFDVYNVEYEFALKKLSGKKFDIVFVDPPYALKIEKKVIDLILKYELLNENGIIVVEHDALNIVYHSCFDIDCRKMGNTSVSFLSRR